MKNILLIFSVIILSSCAVLTGGIRVDNLNYPITMIQKVTLNTLPGVDKKVRRGGREIHVSYFYPEEKKMKFWKAPKDNAGLRFKAVITILNDRRPYTIDVMVNREKRMAGGEFYNDGNDKKVAKFLGKKIKEALAKVDSNRNVIDDFRVF